MNVKKYRTTTKTLKKACSILISTMFIFLLPIRASAMTSVYLSCTPVQAKSNWCWAATAEALGKQASYSTLTQYDVVSTVMGGSWFDPYPNVTGTPYDTAGGAEYVCHYNHDFNVYSAYAFVTVKFQINHGRPIGCALYHQYGGTGHTIVIKGYEDPGTVQIYDPADGGIYNISFSSLETGSYVPNCIYSASIVHMD